MTGQKPLDSYLKIGGSLKLLTLSLTKKGTSKKAPAGKYCT